MKTNYKDKNIFSLVALFIFIVIFFIGSSVWSLFLLIFSFIFSILGIIKANSLKKEINIRKGIILSLLVLSISSIILFVMPVYNLITHYQQKDNVTYSDLNEIEVVALNALKEFYYISGDIKGNIKGIKIDSIYYEEKIDSENTDKNYFMIYINYNDENVNNKKCYNYNNSKTFIHNEKTDGWITSGKKINVDRIIQAYSSIF